MRLYWKEILLTGVRAVYGAAIRHRKEEDYTFTMLCEGVRAASTK